MRFVFPPPGLLVALLIAVLSCGGSSEKELENPNVSLDNPLPSFPVMPSREAETASINQTIGDLSNALTAQDVAASAALFTPEAQEERKKWLESHKDIMPLLAGPLANAPLSTLSEEEGWAQDGSRRRSAEVSLTHEGRTFYITLEKVDDRWLVRTF